MLRILNQTPVILKRVIILSLKLETMYEKEEEEEEKKEE
jgi:hypothetical protein